MSDWGGGNYIKNFYGTNLRQFRWSVLLTVVIGKPSSFEIEINKVNMRVVREHHISRSISYIH